ncbi:MAG: glycosyl hydrolase family 28-related protein [Verrucomicrobiota bacterium]
MRVFLLVSLSLVFSSSALQVSAAAPQIIHATDPVRSDETVLVTGDSFGDATMVEISPVPEGTKGPVKADSFSAIETWKSLEPIQRGEGTLKFVVPKEWAQGIWLCRVRNGAEVSSPVFLNAPSVWWWNGDLGESASPGGWVRVFGKALSFGEVSRARLTGLAGQSVLLTAEESNGYALKFRLPNELADGEYELSVHNGMGGDATWTAAGRVKVRAAPVWKGDTFNVKDFGPKPAEALVAALEKARLNGGGIVFLPRGRYPVKDILQIPPGTILRGESMDLVSLYWPDFEKPPSELITGSNYVVEDVSLYCQLHKNVVTDNAKSESVALRRVRIRANCYFAIEDVAKEFRKRRGPASHMECGAAVELRGRNVEVTDCDIYASNKGIRINRAKTGIVARNRIRYGGRGYNIENTDRLIFEDNLVEGNNLVSIGNDIATFWTNYCQHIYFAHNKLRQMYGADREMMTGDGAGGAYFGTLAAVSGTAITLAGDPEFHDYAPKPHTDWTGAAVQVLSGKGAGQYRFVTANAGREWQVDRPWTVEPDTQSKIAIAPFRGRCLFIGNECEDGGPFQLYAAAHESIVAENKGSRMDGFLVWGLNPHAWGYQPSWYCQFLDNEILVGNGYGSRGAGMSTVAGDEAKTFAGPLVYGTVFRRNKLHNNSGISLSGATSETVLEHNEIRNADVGIRIRDTVRGTLLRENVIEGVNKPLIDDSEKAGR